MTWVLDSTQLGSAFLDKFDSVEGHDDEDDIVLPSGVFSCCVLNF